MSVTINNIVCVTRNDEFLTKSIANVIMLNKLDENVYKLPLLDLNVSNLLLEKNVSNFF